MLANSPGSVSDLVTEEYRALAFSIWSIGPMNGPVTGPVIGGFAAQYLGWRWTNWLVMIFSGVGWLMCVMLPETYGPLLLQRRAAKMRKEMDDDRYWSRYDEKVSSMCLFCHQCSLLTDDECSIRTYQDKHRKTSCVYPD
jgi:MFS family permease